MGTKLAIIHKETEEVTLCILNNGSNTPYKRTVWFWISEDIQDRINFYLGNDISSECVIQYVMCFICKTYIHKVLIIIYIWAIPTLPCVHHYSAMVSLFNWEPNGCFCSEESKLSKQWLLLSYGHCYLFSVLEAAWTRCWGPGLAWGYFTPSKRSLQVC